MGLFHNSQYCGVPVAAWIEKIQAHTDPRLQIKMNGKLVVERSISGDVAVISDISSLVGPLVLKMGISSPQRYWMHQVSKIGSAVMPVIASGRFESDQPLNWLLLRQIGADIPYRWANESFVVDAMVRGATAFQSAAQTIPPQYITQLSHHDIAKWLKDVAEDEAVSSNAKELLNSVERNFDFLTSVCEFEVCHGNMQMKNIRWLAHEHEVVLTDCEPIIQPWPLEIAITEITSGTGINCIKLMNDERRRLGMSFCPDDTVQYISALAKACAAARLWSKEASRASKDGSVTVDPNCLRPYFADFGSPPIISSSRQQLSADRRFCDRPFTYFETAADNHARLCCGDWLPTTIGNVMQASLPSIWNSLDAQAVRSSILDGSFKYCDKLLCPALVQSTLPSVEQVRRNPFFRRLIDQHVTELPYGPLTINFGHDNSCNLKCPTCRPELIALRGSALTLVRRVQSDLERYFIPTAQQLIITGHGDALASPLYRVFLNALTLPRTQIL